MPLVEDAHRAVRALCDLVATERARVRIAVPTGFTQFFAEGLARLRQSLPRLSLEILSGSRPVDLKKGEADLAVRVGPITDKDLIARKLGEAGWSVYASHAYLARRGVPPSLDDLRGHDVIAYDAALAAMPSAKWIELRAVNATVVLLSREMTDMLAAAIGGLGLAALPCSLGEAEPALRRLTTEVIAMRPLSLVYRREARLSKEARAVMKLTADVMREHAAQIGGRAPAKPRPPMSTKKEGV